MSELDLNGLHEGNMYKDYPGRIVDKMPLLIADKRTPLSFAGVMKRRLETNAGYGDDSKGFDEYEDEHGIYHLGVCYDWEHNDFNTGDSLYSHPDGSGMIVLDDELVRGINPDTKLVEEGALDASEVYDGVEGIMLSKKEIQYATLRGDEILDNKIWRILARHPDEVPAEFAEDEALLKEYVNNIMGRERSFELITEGTQDIPMMTLWECGSYEGNFATSSWNRLDSKYGYLVGYAPM